MRGGVVLIPVIHTGSPLPAQVMRELSVGAGQSRHVLEERVAVKQNTYHAPSTANIQDCV